MRQSIHIFGKDVRLLWVEVSLAQAIAVLFTWLVAAGAEQDGVTPTAQYVASEVLSYLLPLSWSFLIARVIYNDPASGDRRFWVTRPISSGALALAKALFALAFVNVPKLVSDVVVIHAYGFDVAKELAGLLWAQILLSGCFVLPIAAVCVLTAGFAQLLSAALVLGLIVVAWNLLMGAADWRGFEWIRLYSSAAVLVAASAAIIRLHYARRRTAPTRLIGAGAIVVAALIQVAFPWKAAFAVQSSFFSKRIAASSVRVEFDRERVRTARAVPASDGRVDVEIPIRVSGLPPGSASQAEAVAAILTGVGGSVWTASGDPRKQVRIEGTITSLYLRVDRRFYERVKTSAVHIRGSLYLTVYGNGRAAFIPMEPQPRLHRTPGVGLCSATGTAQGCLLSCRSAFRSRTNVVSANVVGRERGRMMSFRTLAVSEPAFVSYSPFPAEPALNPITLTRQFTGVYGPVAGVAVRAIEPVAYICRPFEIGGIRLADYEQPESSTTSMMRQ